MRRIVKKHVLVIVFLTKGFSWKCKPGIFLIDKFREESSGLEDWEADEYRRVEKAGRVSNGLPDATRGADNWEAARIYHKARRFWLFGQTIIIKLMRDTTEKHSFKPNISASRKEEKSEGRMRWKELMVYVSLFACFSVGLARLMRDIYLVQ